MQKDCLFLSSDTKPKFSFQNVFLNIKRKKKKVTSWILLWYNELFNWYYACLNILKFQNFSFKTVVNFLNLFFPHTEGRFCWNQSYVDKNGLTEMSDCEFGLFPFVSRTWRNIMLSKMIISLFLIYRHLPALRCYEEQQQCNFGEYLSYTSAWLSHNRYVDRDFILNAGVSVQIWPPHISGKIIPAEWSTRSSNWSFYEFCLAMLHSFLIPRASVCSVGESKSC